MANFGIPLPQNTSNSAITNSLNPSGGLAANQGGDGDLLMGGPFQSSNIFGTPFTVFLGFVFLLILFRVAEEYEGKLPLDPADLHIGPYNVFAIGITSMLFAALSKTLVNRYAPNSAIASFINFSA